MKNKLLIKVRKEYSIRDFPNEFLYKIFCKEKKIGRVYYSMSDVVTKKICLEMCYEDIISRLRSKYPKLGFHNRGNKVLG